jgi:uncharacterized protein YbjT (DUF2867 family)
MTANRQSERFCPPVVPPVERKNPKLRPAGTNDPPVPFLQNPEDPMKMVVFGATGPTGRHVVERALELGHEVTAFARSPEAVEVQHPSLRVVKGDVLDPVAVAEAVRGQDAVISTLGPRNRTTRGVRTVITVASDGVKNILAGMQAHGVRRLVVLSSVGSGASKGQGGFFVEWILKPLFLGSVFADKDRMEEIVRGSGVDWVIVQPTKLTNGPARDRIVVDEQPRVPGRIARADVARFMVAQALEDRWIGRAPMIGG